MRKAREVTTFFGGFKFASASTSVSHMTDQPEIQSSLSLLSTFGRLRQFLITFTSNDYSTSIHLTP